MKNKPPTNDIVVLFCVYKSTVSSKNQPFFFLFFWYIIRNQNKKKSEKADGKMTYPSLIQVRIQTHLRCLPVLKNKSFSFICKYFFCAFHLLLLVSCVDCKRLIPLWNWNIKQMKLQTKRKRCVNVVPSHFAYFFMVSHIFHVLVVVATNRRLLSCFMSFHLAWLPFIFRLDSNSECAAICCFRLLFALFYMFRSKWIVFDACT